MMIFPDQNLIFVHIPKTGGTSLTKYLAPFTKEQFRERETRTHGLGFQGTWHYKGAQHSPLDKKLKNLPPEVSAEIENYKVLTVMRDPRTWILSIYTEFYAVDRGHKAGENFVFGTEFPNRTLNDFYNFCRNNKSDPRAFWGTRSQRWFLEGASDRQIIPLRFEDFSNQLKTLTNYFNIDLSEEVHALGRGPKKRSFISKQIERNEHIEFIKDMFPDDLKFQNEFFR